MADLIVTTPAPVATPAPAKPARRCACERVRALGFERCRWCEWRIATPPPLVAAPFKAESPRLHERSMVGLAGCGAVESARAHANAQRRRRERDAAKVVALRD